ncbi:alpha/beta hydrolase [Chryseobacterium lactis]|uniref:Alpha/beta hydrolase n=1 Tax=Chryseobacterium lactis TaxID=1241981 RepID=A0A3G6RN89_CHRLC|nr:alpha/beta hydrolase [Chryseobacterium lactis]AZA80746.1 alpha/beta hydrolase [Chryseobacterium lactis]AZB05748.1 alpha/beta hydrolase [Chryseobacterium lactis]PNW13533.1 alpha/beta hydrolase [Chryseobacterium lactis]
MIYKKNIDSLLKDIRAKNFYCKSFILALFLLLFTTIQVFAIPPDFTTKDVKFVSNGDTLAGTIIKPEHPVAALVIVHGSGQEKRMMKFATLLAQNGIAVLTYDKRGVGESGGVYAGPEVGTNNIDSANLNLLSLDASAAVNTLKKDLADKQIKIGLIGASQAGWIIPLTAKKNNNVNFMAIFSGALVTARQQLRFQFYTNNDRGFWDTHSEEDARQHTLNDPDKYQFIDTDPLPTLSKLSIPGLWIYGGKDIQVPVQLSIEHLNTLKSKNNRYEYQLFPNLGHNTAFAKDQEPVENVIKWIKTLKSSTKKK